MKRGEQERSEARKTYAIHFHNNSKHLETYAGCEQITTWSFLDSNWFIFENVEVFFLIVVVGIAPTVDLCESGNAPIESR